MQLKLRSAVALDADTV